MASSADVAKFERASRASATPALPCSSLETALPFAVSRSPFDSASFSSIVEATVALTVDTKASLTVMSSVVAPVSVILGATGPSFSLT